MNRAPEVLAVIPARGGSKGLPRKNLALLGGIPLIAHSIKAAQASRAVTRVVVSTDDEEIAETARAFGAEVPFLRPRRIAGDRAEIGHAFQYTLARLKRRGYVPDVEAQLYPTHPFRPPGLIDRMLARLFSGYRLVFTARPVPVGPLTHFAMDPQGLLTPLKPREPGLSPAVYHRPYGLFTARVLGPATGGSWCLPLTDPVSLIDIDTAEDLDLAREVLRAGLFDPGWD